MCLPYFESPWLEKDDVLLVWVILLVAYDFAPPRVAGLIAPKALKRVSVSFLFDELGFLLSSIDFLDDILMLKDDLLCLE